MEERGFGRDGGGEWGAGEAEEMGGWMWCSAVKRPPGSRDRDRDRDWDWDCWVAEAECENDAHSDV